MEVQASDIVSFLWLIFWCVVFYIFRGEAKALLSAIIMRIEKGSGFKVAGLELEPKYENTSTPSETVVIEKTQPSAPGLAPGIEKAIAEAIGDERGLLLLNSIRRLERLVTRFGKRESSLLITGISLPEGFEKLPLRQKIQVIKGKLPSNVVDDLIVVTEMRDKILHIKAKELSDAEFIKASAGAYLIAERLIDYFEDRLFFFRT